MVAAASGARRPTPRLHSAHRSMAGTGLSTQVPADEES